MTAADTHTRVLTSVCMCTCACAADVMCVVVGQTSCVYCEVQVCCKYTRAWASAYVRRRSRVYVSLRTDVLVSVVSLARWAIICLIDPLLYACCISLLGLHTYVRARSCLHTRVCEGFSEFTTRKFRHCLTLPVCCLFKLSFDLLQVFTSVSVSLSARNAL